MIVCADVLEHLVDTMGGRFRPAPVIRPDTALAVSMPNIQFLGAIAGSPSGPDFGTGDEGIFDVTHLQFFTGSDLDRLLQRGGWRPERRGSKMFGEFRAARQITGRVTRGWSDQWLAEQQFVVAGPDTTTRGASK